jgi:hypothetical protein
VYLSSLGCWARMREASAERCLQQAEQHRKMADDTNVPELKAKLLALARSYEDLAKYVGELQRRRSST